MTGTLGMRVTVRLACVAVLLAAAASRPAGQGAAAAIPNLAGKALTVLGPVDPKTIGPTVTHEHIFIARSLPTMPFARPAATELELQLQPVTLENLSAVRNFTVAALTRDYPYNFYDLTDFDDAVAEVREFKRWGGDTIVDVSNIGLGRDPQALVRVANATGLKIVMGSGYYAKNFHPPDMDRRTVEELTGTIVHDVTKGAEGTDIRSGIIGEVGVSGNPLTPNEIKSVRASARASRATGAAITFHVGGFMEEKFTVMDLLVEEGADLSRAVFGHSNWVADDLPFMKRMLARGVYIQFDTLGYTEALTRSRLGRPDDWEVAMAIAELIKAGYGDRIVISQDVCTKMQLKKNGGRGYSYILQFFLPELRRLGVTEDQVQRIMVENPRRILTFVAPQPPGRATAQAQH